MSPIIGKTYSNVVINHVWTTDDIDSFSVNAYHRDGGQPVIIKLTGGGLASHTQVYQKIAQRLAEAASPNKKSNN